MLNGVGIVCAPSARCGTMHKSASVLIGIGRGEFLAVGEKVGDAVVGVGGGMIIVSDIEGIVLNLGLIKPDRE